MITKTNIDKEGNIKIETKFLPFEQDEELSADSINEGDFVLLTEEEGFLNGNDYKEGDLLFNTDLSVSVSIDIDGSINISDYDVDKYEINENGELIKTVN